MTFPNKMVFFDCWNTLVLSCQNHFQKKVSELTISLNNKVRVIKLSIDRETLFHSFDLVKRESSNTVLLPTLSVHHLLNDLHLFRNFQGRVSQVLVFKEQLRSSEIHALGSLLSSVEELGVLDSHLKMRGWIKNHHLSSKIALDFNSFDLRHRHISFLQPLALICDEIIFKRSDPEPKLKDSAKWVTFEDSSYLTPVLFSPCRKSSSLLPFSFCFEFFASDPYQFDLALFQQNFNRPFLLCLKPLSQFNNEHLLMSLYVTWSKTMCNFFSKPRLAVTLNSNQIETQVHQLLGTLLFCTFTSGLPLFPPKICDLYLDILNSLELGVSVHLLNGLFLNRVFLYELSNSVSDLTYFISKLATWFTKYKKIRELIHWNQLFENILFFLAISDFGDSSLDSPHYILSCHLASLLLLFFPFSKASHESLLVFIRDLSLDCFFVPVWREPSALGSVRPWTASEFEEALGLLGSSPFVNLKSSFVKIPMKLLLFQLNSPLLIKSPQKTAVLLDLLFLLLEHHSVVPDPDLLVSSLLALLYNHKNNSSKIIIRCFALLLKQGESLQVLPPCLFNLRKFGFSSAQAIPSNQTLLAFLRDDSYRIVHSDSLIEYLFSMTFSKYSLSGFFDHERLEISNPALLRVFFSLARLIEPNALEKSLQIFLILLKHSKAHEALLLFNSTDVFVALLDFVYRYAPGFRDEDDVKDRAYFFLKGQDSSLASRLDLSKQTDLHDILLYFEGHNTVWGPFLEDARPSNAVFDLSLRLVKLVVDSNLDSNPCTLQVSRLALLSQVYFLKLKAHPLLLKTLPLFFSKFQDCLNDIKSKENSVFYLYVLHAVLLPVDLSFFSSPKYLSPSWLELVKLLGFWLSCNDSLLASFFPLVNPESLLKKVKFKFLNSDKRFPVISSQLDKQVDFCFSDFVFEGPESRRSRSPHAFEAQIETIFFTTKCLLNVTRKLSATVKSVKNLLHPGDADTRLQLNLHLLGSLASLNLHLEVLLLLSRHSSLKRRSARTCQMVARVTGVLAKALFQTLAQVGR